MKSETKKELELQLEDATRRMNEAKNLSDKAAAKERKYYNLANEQRDLMRKYYQDYKLFYATVTTLKSQLGLE